MNVPDELRKCVVFLAFQKADGLTHLAGTGFCVHRSVSKFRRYQYLVTARHVIDGIRDLGLDRVLIRLNIEDGRSTWLESSLRDWVFHPSEPEVDVAIVRITILEPMDHASYPLESIVTQEFLRENSIGPGEEVFVTGLFVHHFGLSSNIPIVLAGNIAALPIEKVQTEKGLIDAYLVEARSIGGISGSPVFLHMGLVRHVDGQVRFLQASTSTNLIGSSVYLMGLVHGHFGSKESDLDTSSLDSGSDHDKINAGIAIVVPIWKVIEVVSQTRLRKEEDEADEAEQQKNLPVMD